MNLELHFRLTVINFPPNSLLKGPSCAHVTTLHAVRTHKHQHKHTQHNNTRRSDSFIHSFIRALRHDKERNNRESTVAGDESLWPLCQRLEPWTTQCAMIRCRCRECAQIRLVSWKMDVDVDVLLCIECECSLLPSVSPQCE